MTWRGWSFADEVLGSYPLAIDPAFRRRLSFLARVSSLRWLHGALRQGTDVAKHIRWVANAYSQPEAR